MSLVLLTLLLCGLLLTRFLSDSLASQRVTPPLLPLSLDLQVAQQVFWSSVWSKDTIAAYETRKAKWMEFSARFQRSPLDLSPSNLIDYTTYLATIAKKGQPLAYSSIKAYVDFLGRAASFTNPAAPNPAQHPEVKLFLRGVARILGKEKEKAEPCTLGHLRQLTTNSLLCPTPETLTAALIALLAFWGCLRLGNLIPKSVANLSRVLSLKDVTVTDRGLVLVIRDSKTIQFHERVHLVEVPAHQDPLLCPLRAFHRWISLLRPQSSQTKLCALSSTGTTTLSRSKFLSIVNKLTHPLTPLSGHSFRRGFVRLAISLGIPIDRLMQHGDWKSLKVAMSYGEDFMIPNPLANVT